MPISPLKRSPAGRGMRDCGIRPASLCVEVVGGHERRHISTLGWELLSRYRRRMVHHSVISADDLRGFVAQPGIRLLPQVRILSAGDMFLLITPARYRPSYPIQRIMNSRTSSSSCYSLREASSSAGCAHGLRRMAIMGEVGLRVGPLSDAMAQSTTFHCFYGL